MAGPFFRTNEIECRDDVIGDCAIIIRRGGGGA